MKNRVAAMILVLIMGIVMSGCSNTNNEGGNPQDKLGDNDSDGIVIQQYFGSSAYVYDGQDEENGELMPAVEYTLNCGEDDNVYIEAVNSLLETPEGDEKYCTMVTKDYTINNISVSDGIAYVDFSAENLEGGTTNEIVLIDQIVYTLCNSFEEIGAVQFTIDGSKADTLMGNIDISEAFVADYVEMNQ